MQAVEVKNIMVRKLAVLGLILAALLISAAATMAQSYPNYCTYAPQPRLVAGQTARVTPGLPNVLRSQPWRGAGSVVVGEIPAGALFTPLAGYAPQCGSGMYWWYVSYNGMVGWTPEGDAYGTYWTEPYYDNNAGCGYLPTRLSHNMTARVTPGLPNVIRSQPGRGNGVILGQIPGGGVFNVLSQSSCAGGMIWWQVNYQGVVGWTAEGEGSTYWLEPYYGGGDYGSCNGYPSSALFGTLQGYVTPGLPNTIRPLPSTNSGRLGSIPGGGVFSIVDGPECGQGMIWWKVNYNGIIGWTAEGYGYQQWLMPL